MYVYLKYSLKVYVFGIDVLKSPNVVDMPVRVKSPELQRYIERGTLTFDAEAVKMSAVCQFG